jgi:hypothetical protein
MAALLPDRFTVEATFKHQVSHQLWCVGCCRRVEHTKVAFIDVQIFLNTKCVTLQVCTMIDQYRAPHTHNHMAHTASVILVTDEKRGVEPDLNVLKSPIVPYEPKVCNASSMLSSPTAINGVDTDPRGNLPPDDELDVEVAEPLDGVGVNDGAEKESVMVRERERDSRIVVKWSGSDCCCGVSGEDKEPTPPPIPHFKGTFSNTTTLKLANGQWWWHSSHGLHAFVSICNVL